MVSAVYNTLASAPSPLFNAVKRVSMYAPAVLKLADAPDLGTYAAAVWQWKADPALFPHSDKLKSLIVEKVRTLYGDDTAAGIDAQLSHTSVLETGLHVCLPRDLDKKESPRSANRNINTLAFQGTLYMGALQHGQGNKYNLSVVTGRVPLNNSLSARYFQPTADKDLLISTAPNKYNSGPESFIPSIPAKFLEDQINGLKRKLSETERHRADLVLDIFRDTASGFADQATKAHSHLITEAFGDADIKQVTISLDLAWTYFADLLDDSHSLMHKIFADEAIRNDFILSLVNVRTGWKDGESPFDQLEERKGAKTLKGSYQGPLDPATLSAGIRKGEIIPKGLLEFTTLMVEGGIVPLGGMFQSAYCSEIRSRVSDVLDRHGFTDNATALRQMPIDIAIISPVWGVIRRDTDIELATYSDILDGTVQLNDRTINNILRTSGYDSFTGSLLSLHDFLESDEAFHLTSGQRQEISRIVENSTLHTFAPAVSTSPKTNVLNRPATL